MIIFTPKPSANRESIVEDPKSICYSDDGKTFKRTSERVVCKINKSLDYIQHIATNYKLHSSGMTLHASRVDKSKLLKISEPLTTIDDMFTFRTQKSLMIFSNKADPDFNKELRRSFSYQCEPFSFDKCDLYTWHLRGPYFVPDLIDNTIVEEAMWLDRNLSFEQDGFIFIPERKATEKHTSPTGKITQMFELTYLYEYSEDAEGEIHIITKER